MEGRIEVQESESMCGPLNTTLVNVYMNHDSHTVDVSIIKTSNLCQRLPWASGIQRYSYSKFTEVLAGA